jgi:hypothetical protein
VDDRDVLWFIMMKHVAFLWRHWKLVPKEGQSRTAKVEIYQSVKGMQLSQNNFTMRPYSSCKWTKTDGAVKTFLGLKNMQELSRTVKHWNISTTFNNGSVYIYSESCECTKENAVKNHEYQNAKVCLSNSFITWSLETLSKNNWKGTSQELWMLNYKTAFLQNFSLIFFF